MTDATAALLLAAAKEAVAFLDAPEGSPRLWPISRVTLHMMLSEAIAAAEKEPIDISN